MITCLIGTRAQLIKMAPVMLELERRGIPFNFILTGQHQETMARLLGDFGIRTTPKVLYQGREITGVLQMGWWFLLCMTRLLRPGNPYLWRMEGVMVVHGDTMSTLLGAVAGWLKGMTVAHVEAGLRSFNLLHPFPEELTRLAVFRLSDLSFCAGEWACSNMSGRNVRIVDTGQNTLRDALRIALEGADADEKGEYGVVSIHRFENISGKKQLSSVLDLIEQAAKQTRLVFVLHPSTRNKLARFGLMARLESNANIELRPRMGYIEFVRLLRRACFVITDGGGNQEELSYLGVPTLLMRKATERQEGLDGTAVLGRYDRSVLTRFLEQLPESVGAMPEADCRPSEVVVDALVAYAG